MHRQLEIQRKLAFTLAEVLITLGIIGVVAALTFPILIKSYEEKAIVTQFKKVHSALFSAYTQSAQENGTADTWVDTATAYANLKPFLSVQSDCGISTPCTRPSFKYLDESYSGGGANHYHLILSDATIIQFGGGAVTSASGGWTLFDHNVVYYILLVDINGLKKPNQMGMDIFFFGLTTRKGSPVVTAGLPQWNLLELSCCEIGATPAWYRGGSCAFWVFKHGNLDYLKRRVSASEWYQ